MFESLIGFFSKKTASRFPHRSLEFTPPEINLPSPEEMQVLVYGDICLKLFQATQELKRHEGSDTRRAIVGLCDDVSEDLSNFAGGRYSREISGQALTHIDISEHVRASNQQQLVEMEIIQFIKQHMQEYINKLLASKDARVLGGEFLVESIKLVFANLPKLGLDVAGRDKMNLFVELLSETWLALDERQKRNLKRLFNEPNVQALFQDLEYYLSQGLREKGQRDRIIKLGRQQMSLGGALKLCRQVAAISDTIRTTLDQIVVHPSHRGGPVRPSQLYEDNRAIINQAMDVLSGEIHRLANVNQQEGLGAAVSTMLKLR